jgi:hypothetical protein
MRNIGKQKLLILAICVAGILAIFILHFTLTTEHVYLMAVSPDGRYIAQIVWKRVFPYIQGVDAFLLVKDKYKNRTKLRKTLLVNRDDFGDIENEFTGIIWRGNDIFLNHNPQHYKGPTVFRIDPN